MPGAVSTPAGLAGDDHDLKSRACMIARDVAVRTGALHAFAAFEFAMLAPCAAQKAAGAAFASDLLAIALS
jgi:hypothetical protein